MVGNPSVIDPVTGEHFAMDESGFAKFKAKYNQVTMLASPDEFRVLVEAINLYKRELGLEEGDEHLELLNSIDYIFSNIEK